MSGFDAVGVDDLHLDTDRTETEMDPSDSSAQSGQGLQEVSVITASRPTNSNDSISRKSVIASRSSYSDSGGSVVQPFSENSVIVPTTTTNLVSKGSERSDLEQTEAKDYSKCHLNMEESEMDAFDELSKAAGALNDRLDFSGNLSGDDDDVDGLSKTAGLQSRKKSSRQDASTPRTKVKRRASEIFDGADLIGARTSDALIFSTEELLLKKESGLDSESETPDIIEETEIGIKRQNDDDDLKEIANITVKKDPSENCGKDQKDNDPEIVEVKLEIEYDEYLQSTTKPSQEIDVDCISLSKRKLSKEQRNGEFPCMECDYVAKRKDKLNMHFKINHLGFKHKCDMCSMEFARPDKLKKHKSQKHGIDTIYTCDSCTFNTYSYKEYHTHIKQHPAKMYKCNYCSYFSPRQIRLKDHIERKHENGAYPCDICGFIAVSSRTLTRHKESKHSDYQYPCEMCDYKGRRPDHLVAHQKRVHKVSVNSEHVRKNNCINSDGQKVEPETKSTVQQLLKTEEETDQDFLPLEDNQIVNDLGDVKPELKEETMIKFKTEVEDYDEDMGMDHVGESMFGDANNDEELAKMNPIEWLMLQGALTYEVKKEYDDDKETKFNPMDFIATEIQREVEEEFNEVEDDDDPSYNPKRKSTDTKNQAATSVGTKKVRGRKKSDPAAADKTKEPAAKKKKYKSKATGPFLCPVEGCDYTTPRRDKLNLHNKTKHLGIRFPCDICGFQAMRRDKLKMHKERKHFNPQPRKKRVPKYEQGQVHYCDKCDYKSNKIKNLQAHSERVHSESTFPCDQCEFVTTYKLNLKLHVDRMHSTKILMCDKCSYTTKDPVRLKYHNEGKHEDTKHPCDLCDYVGSLRCELMRHFRRKHRAETYKCDQCDYVGRRPDHLRDHKRRIHETVHESGGVKTPKKRRMKEKPAAAAAVAAAMLPASSMSDFYPQAVIRPTPAQSVVRPTPPQAHSSLSVHQVPPHPVSQNHLHLVDEKPTPRELSMYASTVQNLSGYAAATGYSVHSPTHSDHL